MAPSRALVCFLANQSTRCTEPTSLSNQPEPARTRRRSGGTLGFPAAHHTHAGTDVFGSPQNGSRLAPSPEGGAIPQPPGRKSWVASAKQEQVPQGRQKAARSDGSALIAQLGRKQNRGFQLLAGHVEESIEWRIEGRLRSRGTGQANGAEIFDVLGDTVTGRHAPFHDCTAHGPTMGAELDSGEIRYTGTGPHIFRDSLRPIGCDALPPATPRDIL